MMKRVRINADRILESAKDEENLLESSTMEAIYIIRALRVLNEYGTEHFEVRDEDINKHSQVKFDLDENNSIWVHVIED